MLKIQDLTWVSVLKLHYLTLVQNSENSRIYLSVNIENFKI